MQALVTALERCGFAIQTSEKATHVIVLDEAFEIALIERFKQVQVKHTWGSSQDLAPSGRRSSPCGLEL
jgi:hypothetical protein